MHAREELGIDPRDLPAPLYAAGLSLVCFLVGALLPVIPWMIGEGGRAAWASLAIGVAAAAVVGAVVGKSAERPIGFAVVRQVLILLVACGATYLIGELVGVNLE